MDSRDDTAATRIGWLVHSLAVVVLLCGTARPHDTEHFYIGVWQPGGHKMPNGVLDISFAATDATDLTALGVDLLVDSTPRVTKGYKPNSSEYPAKSPRYFESLIMKNWNPPPAYRRMAVYFEPDTVTTQLTLEHFAGNEQYATPKGANLDLGQLKQLDETASLLFDEWGNHGGLYGYRVGHEGAPNAKLVNKVWQGGIYNSITYPNLETVISYVRKYDKVHRIIAIGDVKLIPDTAEFRQHFFSFVDKTNPGVPPNVFMHERYVITDQVVSGKVEQQQLDSLINSFDECGDMVKTAIDEQRRAEWHFIVNAIDQKEYQLTAGGKDFATYEFDAPTGKKVPKHKYHLRYPTLAELQVQVLLALSRGAKGITYFGYTSSMNYACFEAPFSPAPEPKYLVDNFAYKALVDNPSRKHMGQWKTVHAVNTTLRAIGDEIYPLVWVKGFPCSKTKTPPSDSFVEGVDGDSLECGTFYAPLTVAALEKDYLLVVNRKGVFEGTKSQDVIIHMNAKEIRGKGQVFAYEIVPGAAIGGPQKVDATNGLFELPKLTMKPGEGRLFAIEKHQ